MVYHKQLSVKWSKKYTASPKLQTFIYRKKSTNQFNLIDLTPPKINKFQIKPFK